MLLLLVPLALATTGYTRFPALHGDTLVFTSEGDLWRVPVAGGTAIRLTTDPGQETHAVISPDGTQVAFTASYDGPSEVYTMPLDGGIPERLSWDGGRGAFPVAWTPEGEVLYRTRHLATLPDWQLVAVDPSTHATRRLPLSQAADAAFDGEAVIFTRLARMSSHTRRYKGGTAETLWRWTPGDTEATPLSADWDGTSSDPLWWNGRIVFVTDRDGSLNLWSMKPDGTDRQQLTHHRDLEVLEPSLDGDRVAYRLGADIRVLDLKTGQDRLVDIALPSDQLQAQERWVSDPMSWTTAAHLSPKGDRVVVTTRGQVFVMPVGPGRRVELSRAPGVRYRSARFLADGEHVVALSDQSGEVEVWVLPADGLGAPEQRSHDGRVLRFDAIPSPDGQRVAWIDKDDALWIMGLDDGQPVRVLASDWGPAQDLAWSPDSRWLAYAAPQSNLLMRVFLADATTGQSRPVSTGRTDDTSPAFTPDGHWLAFLSDRKLDTLVRSPWGSHQPEPFLDKSTQVFLLALQPGLRSPWAPPDELHLPQADDADDGSKKKKKKLPDITWDGLTTRLVQAPIPAGNYSSLSVTGDRLFWLSWDRDQALDPVHAEEQTLQTAALSNGERGKAPEVSTLCDGVLSYEIAGDQLLARRQADLLVMDAGDSAPDPIDDAAVDLSGWSFPLDPAEEWAQMYNEAWRLERDYFYDPHMHGVDWAAMRERYAPLAARVRDRAELADVLAQMISELSALHMFVYGGDQRVGDDMADPADLGAQLSRVEDGWRVDHIYQTDPDLPEQASPLAARGVELSDGDVILAVNGVSEAPSIGALLRDQAGAQVRLKIRHGKQTRDVIVRPVGSRAAADLRYQDWEYSRRLRVEERSHGTIGYVHLRGMGGSDWPAWSREFYANIDKQGLIVDVRHNHGGSIDSWVLEKLMRPAWFWWQGRVGKQVPNMQEAFIGYKAVLIDELTASDGEAFAEGFRRLGMGPVIGTRTWGGEIWLSSSNVLVDNGIATAAEYGVYGPDGDWLIEGRGVEPDQEVDNPPHATFGGQDAQLDAAIDTLMEKIAAAPPTPPAPPAYPDKSGR